MKRFLAGKCCDVQQMMQYTVIISVLMTATACSVGGGYSSSYIDNAQANVVSTGETAVVNDLGVRKVQSPHFLTNDPYTALSPDEIIRLYGK